VPYHHKDSSKGEYKTKTPKEEKDTNKDKANEDLKGSINTKVAKNFKKEKESHENTFNQNQNQNQKHTKEKYEKSEINKQNPNNPRN